MKGQAMKTGFKNGNWQARMIAVLVVVALALCGVGLVSSFAQTRNASAADGLADLASTKVNVQIKKTGDQLGEASLDKEVYYVGNTAVLKWKGKQVGNNLVIPQSIKYNDITIPLGTLTRVDAVQTENTE